MVLTDIMREEENEENEKQIIISLGVAIAVVAMALINNGGSTTNFLNNIL
jgi:hypothetical protein